MRESIREFLLYLELERGLSPTTRASYQQDLALFETFLRQRKIVAFTQVRSNHVREFLQALSGSHKSPATVSRKLSAVKGLFRFLEGQQQIERSPTAFIESPRLWHRLPQTLSVPEVERLPRRGRAEGLGRRDLAVRGVLF